MTATHSRLSRFKFEICETFKLGTPIVIAQLLHISMGFVDTAMTGNLSAKDLSAVSVSVSVTIPLLIFGIALLNSTQALVAHSFGANLKKPQIGIITSQAIWIAQLVGWFLYYLSGYFHHLMPWFNIAPDVIELARSYISYYGLALPAMLTVIAINSFYLGIRVTRLGVAFSVLGLTVNICGNYTFIYGNFGAPQLGAVGAGITSAMSAWTSLTGFIIFTLVNKEFRDYKLLRQLRFFKPKVIKDIFKLGIPNGMSGVFEVSMFGVFTLLMGNFGTNTLAASQIALNVASIAFMIPLGLSSAITTRIGILHGKGDPQSARLAGYYGMILCLMVMTVTANIMFWFPGQIVRIYSQDMLVQEIAVSLLFLAGIFQLSDGLQAAGMGALRGYKDTKWPMVVNLFSYWGCGMGTGYLLAFRYELGAVGLWTGLCFGLSVAAMMHITRFTIVSKRFVKQV